MLQGCSEDLLQVNNLDPRVSTFQELDEKPEENMWGKEQSNAVKLPYERMSPND